ncbi:MAG: hypothetical protein HY811_01945 [Planctomycetes bacterium]|nr:hypothetical protein [Planctomycetota bacterium]
MQEQAKCRYCLSGGKDFRDDFTRALWDKIQSERFSSVFKELQKQIPLLARFPNAETSVWGFQDIKSSADTIKNEIVAGLVSIIKTHPALTESTVSYLLLLIIPNLKSLGCRYCDGLIPVYDPFDEAYLAAYKAITKGKFKKGDLVLMSIIRRIKGALNRLCKKEFRLKEGAFYE